MKFFDAKTQRGKETQRTTKTSALQRLCMIGSVLFCSIVVAIPAAGQGHDALQSEPIIVINEILAHTDPPLDDTVELYNTTNVQQDLSFWCLSDDKDEPCLLQFMAGTLIEPYGFLMIQFDENSPFRLSEAGETITLSAATQSGTLTGYSQVAKFGANPNGVSMGRVAASDGEVYYPLLASLTLGATNSPPLVSPVVIEEILFRPAAGKPQYVVIANHSAAAQPLFHPELADTPWQVAGLGELILPDGLTLTPGERLYLASVAPATLRAAYGLPASMRVLGPWGGTLQSDGERVALLRPDKPDEDLEATPMIEVDTVRFQVGAPWPAIGTNAGVPMQRLSPWVFGSFPENWSGSGVVVRFLPMVEQ